MSAINLGGLVNDPADTGGNSGSQLSLSDLASGVIQKIFNAAGDTAANAISNISRSQNTQPTPDLSAVAAKPQTASYLDSAPFGVSMPILVLGLGALAYIALRK